MCKVRAFSLFISDRDAQKKAVPASIYRALYAARGSRSRGSEAARSAIVRVLAGSVRAGNRTFDFLGFFYGCVFCVSFLLCKVYHWIELLLFPFRVSAYRGRRGSTRPQYGHVSNNWRLRSASSPPLIFRSYNVGDVIDVIQIFAGSIRA